MKRLILGAAFAALIINAAQAQQTLREAEMFNDCQAARGEVPLRPLGVEPRELTIRRAQVTCDVYKKVGLDRERQRAAAEREAELRAERLKAEAAQREREQILFNQRLAEEAAARAEQNKRDAEAHAIQLDREREITAEKQKKFEAEQAERKRIADVKAAEEAKPINVLFRAYTRYAYVKFCNQVREGYVLQYINDIEMQRATSMIKAIKDKAIKDEPNLDTDYTWNQGLQEAQRLLNANAMGPDQCHWAYGDLLDMSPTTPYVVAKPN
jgi:hypothetical protein